jgi:chromosome segregation ATPase
MPTADLSLPSALFLHIGARGDATLQPAAEQSGIRQILVQPDPVQAEALRQSASPETEVLELGLAAEDGRAELLQMNFPALNSFHEPTAALKSLFPGLKVQRRQVVPTLSPASLLKQIGAEQQIIDLALDAPGSEMALLHAWKAGGALKNIRHLTLRCGQEVFFENADAKAEIEAWLAAEGFAKAGEDLTDPDWPISKWHADPILRTLKASLAEAQTRAKTAEEKAATLNASLTEARAATDEKSKALTEAQSRAKTAEEKAATLSASLTEARAATDEKSKALTEAQSRAKTAEEKAATLNTSLTEARAATEDKTKGLTDAQTRAKTAEDKAAAINTSLTEARAATEDKAKALTEAQTRAKTAEEKAATLNASLTEARAATDEKSKALTEAQTRAKTAEDKAAALNTALTEARAATEDKTKALTEAQTRAKTAEEKLAALNASLTEARAATEDKAKALTEAQTRAKTAEEKLAALNTSLTEARAATDEKSKALTEVQSRADTAEDKAAALNTSLTEARAATDEKSKALTEAQTRAKTAEDKAAALNTSLTEARAATEDKAKALTEAQSRAKTAEEKIKTLDAAHARMTKLVAQHADDARRYQLDLLQARKDLGVAMRMQTLAQEDLKELQTRFEASQAIRGEQEALLRQLTPRLRLAAQQLHALTQDRDISALAVAAPRDGLPPPAAEAQKPDAPARSGKKKGKKKA